MKRADFFYIVNEQFNGWVKKVLGSLPLTNDVINAFFSRQRPIQENAFVLA